MSHQAPPLDYLAASFFAPGKVSALVGYAASGKAPFAVSLALCVARGVKQRTRKREQQMTTTKAPALSTFRQKANALLAAKEVAAFNRSFDVAFDLGCAVGREAAKRIESVEQAYAAIKNPGMSLDEFHGAAHMGRAYGFGSAEVGAVDRAVRAKLARQVRARRPTKAR